MPKKLKKNEQKLLEDTVRVYRSITKNSMDGFWMTDEKGHILDVNDAYCKLMGYDREELLKMTISDVENNKRATHIAKYFRQRKGKSDSRFLTRHRKKNGDIVDIEVSSSHDQDLSGFVFIILRDVTKQKFIADKEKKIAKKHEKMKKHIESQLTKSYKHLGTINRKISILLELNKLPKSKKEKQKAVEYVLRLAMNVSKAPTGYLYGSKGRGKFNLLACKGLNKKEREKIEVISSRTVKLLKLLLKEKSIITGDIQRYEAQLLALDNDLEHFITLPLSKGNKLGGFIFLGFDKKKSLDAQDLEFLDVFAIHASNALTNAGALD